MPLKDIRAGVSGSLNGQRFTASGDRVGRPLRFTSPPLGVQDQPVIAMAADGGFFAAWSRSVPGSLSVIGRRFASDGKPRGGEIRLDRPPNRSNGTPAVALGSDGRGVVVWLRYDDKISVFARRLVP